MLQEAQSIILLFLQRAHSIRVTKTHLALVRPPLGMPQRVLAAVTTAKRCHHVTSVLQGCPGLSSAIIRELFPSLSLTTFFHFAFQVLHCCHNLCVCLFILWSPAAGGGQEPGDTVRTHGGRGIPISSLFFPSLGHRVFSWC